MNLALKYRPKNLDEFIGQEHIIGSTKPLYKLIKKGQIPHLFFWGVAGVGKTSLARIISSELDFDFYEKNATSIKVQELREIFDTHKNSLRKPLIFIDEVHRLSKNQQEVLLPIMENYEAIIVGASTENPFYTLTSAIRSRSMVFEFKKLKESHLSQIIDLLDLDIEEKAKEYAISSSGGDARAMLNLLDFGSKVSSPIDLETLKSLRPTSLNDGSSSNQTHYDLISAMIKSIRGSDIDASLYYLSRLIKGGENPEFIARRLLILSSEDIGNANPNALNLATSTMLSVAKIGYPEARIILSQCVIYLASSPKSNSAYSAINLGIKMVEDGVLLDIPNHIKDNAVGYKYPHDNNGWIKQTYLQKPIKLYKSKGMGFEKTLNEWSSKIKGIIYADK
jgi:putative ATPase